MLRQIDARSWPTADSARIRSEVPRGLSSEQLVADVEPIVAAVRERGLAAAIEYSLKFDGVAADPVRVTNEAISNALENCDAEVVAALQTAIARVTKVHESQMSAARDIETNNGGRVTNRWVPIERVGLYVPAGGAIYPSSVVMNAVPAQIAGVKSIAVASPPQRDNNSLPHPLVLATCALLGIDEVYAIGGAQAIALLAFGDETIEPVDLITGPGNAYVAGAKRLVNGVVGIDSEAGPTEITIVADDAANARVIAADLIAQAEHDPASAAVLITNSASLIEKVNDQLGELARDAKHQERVKTALTGTQSAAVLTESIEQSLALADAYASEHLHLHTKNAKAQARDINHAGAIFIGESSPVALGDYLAGSNHVLPTGATARFASGISVFTFLRLITEVDFTADELAALSDKIQTLARTEDLPAHADSIAARESIAP
jgi:histidinol dehydrogenase